MAEKKPFQLISKVRCAHRSRLNAAQQQTYDLIAEAMARRETSVRVRGRLGEDLTEIFKAVIHDQPFLFDVNRTEVSGTSSPIMSTIRWEYRMPDEEAERCRVQINAELRRILGMLPDSKDAVATERAIHDLILTLGIRKPQSGRGEWWTHTIIGPLLYRETVCEGAAQLFYTLCLLKGVPCRMVTGKGNGRVEGPGPHAWNMVRLGSQFAHVDAYWDLCLTFPGEPLCYDYFNLQDTQMALDHTWDREKFPVSTAESHSWFVKHGAEIDTPEELRALLVRLSDCGATEAAARFRRAVEKDAVAGVMRDACQNIFRRRLQWDYNDRQRVVHLSVLG